MKTILLKSIGIGTVMSLAACVDPPEETGQSLFMSNCVMCHGVDAKGADDLGGRFGDKTLDLTGLSKRNDGVFPRNYVLSVIDGYRRDKHFLKAMPEFGDGDLGPTVVVELEDGVGTPIPKRLFLLADYLESLQE